MSLHTHLVLTTSERRLVGLLAIGQTPAQAGAALRLAPEQAEAMLVDLLRRNHVPARRQLLARALVYGWI